MPDHRRVITLTTDFGLQDPFVGIMKGVILSISPQAALVDLTHSIPRQDVRRAAIVLASAYSCFPEGTIHLAVVDPGVGTKRAPLVIQAGKYFFVGPDNGLFSLALKKEKPLQVLEADNSSYMLPRIGCTFHGRDVFAPLAAHLANGISIKKLGKPKNTWVNLDFPVPVRKGRTLEGVILDIDQFGNLMTNFSSEDLDGKSGWEIRIGSSTVKGISACYGENEPGTLLAVPGSSGYLEIAVNGGSARDILGARAGDRVAARRMPAKEGTAD